MCQHPAPSLLCSGLAQGPGPRPAALPELTPPSAFKGITLTSTLTGTLFTHRLLNSSSRSSGYDTVDHRWERKCCDSVMASDVPVRLATISSYSNTNPVLLGICRRDQTSLFNECKGLSSRAEASSRSSA